jgi:hypothetical protein
MMYRMECARCPRVTHDLVEMQEHLMGVHGITADELRAQSHRMTPAGGHHYYLDGLLLFTATPLGKDETT